MYLADTNIFIRFLTNDDPKKSAEVRDQLLKVKNKESEVTTTEGVLIEIVQVLNSKVLYNLTRNDIRKRLTPILLLEKLKLENKNIYLLALDYFVEYNIDFTDCILAAKSKNFDGVYSYDKDFDKIECVARVESL